MSNTSSTSTLSTRFDKLPELMRAHHLVEIGLFPSEDSVYLARFRGNGESPDYIKLKRKILYPKSAVIAFLERHLKDASAPRTINNEVGE